MTAGQPGGLHRQRLEGQRVYLRPIEPADTESILRWRAQPAVADQLFSERPPTQAEHEGWLASLQQRADRAEFVIVARAGDRPIGTIGLSSIDRERGEAEYGILIGEAEWRGQGAAREASELILAYAFEALELQQVFLNLFADNQPARRLYARLGFVEDPAMAGERPKSGEPRKTAGMRLQREAWAGHAARSETTP